jgi:hypothetical protein
VISLMCARVGSGTVDRMPANALNPEPRRLARHPQRPWRPVESEPRLPRRAVEHRFAAPLVRELPPRRELRVATGTW